jgi:hypothetical protein
LSAEEKNIFQEWDWAFGQTPEFTYSISRAFEWGDVVSQFNKDSYVRVDSILDGEDTLEAWYHPVVLIGWRRYVGYRDVGETRSRVGGPKVWFPQQRSEA